MVRRGLSTTWGRPSGGLVHALVLSLSKDERLGSWFDKLTTSGFPCISRTSVVHAFKPAVAVQSTDALSRHRQSEAGTDGSAGTGHRRSHARERFSRRRRVPPEHGGRAPTGRRPRAMGRGVLLPDAARRRARVLGGVLRSHKGPGRARANPLPRSERDGAVGVRRLRLLRPPRRTPRHERVEVPALKA